MANGKPGRPKLSAAEKKRRKELRDAERAKNKTRTPRQARRPRSADTLVELPPGGWWQTVHASGFKAVILNPATQEFRVLDLDAMTMKRLEQQPEWVTKTATKTPDTGVVGNSVQRVGNASPADELEIPASLRRQTQNAA